MSDAKIIYTMTDEAPALATYSLLPIVKAFTATAGVEIETRDISLAGRIIANFADQLPENQQQSDDLAYLGELAKTPQANIIKTPNISASIPQLQAAITELKGQGYALPDYPLEADSEEDKSIRARYAKVLGSAVNPVLREGNSDRRVAGAVKEYAKKHPHSMGAWSADSKSHVASMTDGDFYASEQSHVMSKADTVKIALHKNDGDVEILRDAVAVQEAEIIDSARMSVTRLRAFYQQQIDDALKTDVLLSLHLKATMMKVSDPIMFGHAVTVYYADLFDKYADLFASIGVNPKNGIGDVEDKIKSLPEDQQQAIREDMQAIYAKQPRQAMVDSDKGITNLHVPSNVIVDASMPAALRSSGKMWGPDGKLDDTKAMIPDRCYAGVYQAVIDFCKKHGAFDVSTMGNVSNVGLMAQKAEEYGSHDKTFEIPADGTVKVTDSEGNVLMSHEVQQGDIWRMCQTRDLPVQDWVKLAVNRARLTGNTAIFWLDSQRAHDANLIKKVNAYLQDHDTDDLDIQILAPIDATLQTLDRVKAGQDTISVTGNVLRDYLTDLFPILELGTSAKMLSIVPLLAGGGLFETGAGGSAPKHVQQVIKENHLRWDSLGEYLAIAVSLEDLAQKTADNKIAVMAKALDSANALILNNDRSPSRKAGELDTRGSHFYLALYWAQALAEQSEDPDLQTIFKPVADTMSENESLIVQQLNDIQGVGVDLGGYYHALPATLESIMRPSAKLNEIIDAIG